MGNEDTTFLTNQYREQRRAELEKICMETGLSKRRIRKREVLFKYFDTSIVCL